MDASVSNSVVTLPNPVTIGALTHYIGELLEQSFPASLRVVGETSGVSIPSSGHCYFTLKDRDEGAKREAILDALMWNYNLRRVPFELKNGMSVVCTGKLVVFPGRGKYQLEVTSIEPVGVGSYELAKKQVEDKLRREGLFSPDRKRPLPVFPQCVGVVTSLTGAALRDFLNVTYARCKRMNVVVAQARVQGDGAAQDVIDAINLLNVKRKELKLEALVLIRGGGSVEDLWTFNDENVARAVANSALPVLTGIGHEIDTSICDLVADVKALTPTDAGAKITSRDDNRLLDDLASLRRRMLFSIERMRCIADERLARVEASRVFSHPYEILYEKRAQRLTDLESRLASVMEKKLTNVERMCEMWRERLAGRDPKSILARGYSITRRIDDGVIIRDPSDLSDGQILETTLACGKVRSVVIK